MNVKMMKTLLILAVLGQFAISRAGTIFFKSGSKISEVEIVSIQSGRITIEKDGAKKTIPLKMIESFYNTDLESSSGTIPEEYAEYTVSIQNIDMPKKGEDSKGKTESCVIEYSINRKSGTGKKAPFPYFYLYVLTSGKNDEGGREIFRYHYPKDAKIKSKSYDRAAILKVLSELDRPMTHFGRGSGLRAAMNMGAKEIKFALKGVDKRHILAYRLEVWGKDDLIKEKEDREIGVKVGKKWWERY